MELLKTIDAKIDLIKHDGIVNLPRQNLLSNLPLIESIIYETKPYKLFNDDEEPIDTINMWAIDGGSIRPDC